MTDTPKNPKIRTVIQPPTPEGPPPPRATVLVASSDSATRDLLRRILDVPAVEVVDASDGVEALALARRLSLDLVVLDAFLAVMDGLSVCARIRALTDVDQPPILVLGLRSERSIEVALTSGADETLAKPLNPALLRYRVRVLLVRRQEERRLRLLQRAVEAAPFGLALLDARSSEYEVALANPAFQRQTGYAAGELLGKNLRLLAGPATDVAAMTELRQAMAEGRPTRVLLRSYRKDGQAFWNDLAASPVVDAAGRLTHYVSMQSDVTALLEAPEREAALTVDEAVAARTTEVEAALLRVEERRRFTETILNSLVSAILATDAQGTVTFANLAALRTLGTSLHDCVGRSVVELFGHHEGVAEVIAGTVPAHPEHRLDFPLISPGGTRFYVGMSITPAPAAFREEVGFIFLFRDLAETIDIETDPKLRQLAVAFDEADARPVPALAEAPVAEPEAKHRVGARPPVHGPGRPRARGDPGPRRAAPGGRRVRPPRDVRRRAGGPARPAAGDRGAHHPARKRARGLPRPVRGAGAPDPGGDDGRTHGPGRPRGARGDRVPRRHHRPRPRDRPRGHGAATAEADGPGDRGEAARGQRRPPDPAAPRRGGPGADRPPACGPLRPRAAR